MNTSRSFRAPGVKGHWKDFQIRHCRRSSTFRAASKMCSCCIRLCFCLSSVFQAGRQKAGRERNPRRARWCKGQVTLAVTLKYHSSPGARHRLWCSEGVCDKSGGNIEGKNGERLPTRSEIDEELLTESSTVGKSSALMLCCLYSLLWKECSEDLILS